MSPLKKITAFTVVIISFVSSYAQETEHTYPEIKGYVGILAPIYTFSSDGNTANFQNAVTLGMPVGINIIKSDKIGFSFEVAPLIRTNDKVSKVSNIIFHPGIIFRLGHGCAFVMRAAFETSGRYGFTPVINKVLKRYKSCNVFTCVNFACRFGNNAAASVAPGIQLGIGF